MNMYKALFILDSSLGDEAQEKVINRIKAEAEKLGGEISGETIMGKRQFVRTMQKKDTGVYVDFALNLDPLQVASLKARLKLVEGIFRVQITRAIVRKAKSEAVA